jgi:hypothetical protein
MGYVHRHGRAYDTLPFVPARARHSQWRTKAGGRRTQSQYRARIAVTSAPEGTLPRVCTAALCRFLVGAFTMHRVAVKKNPQKKNGRNHHRDRMACDAPSAAAAGNVDMVVVVDLSELGSPCFGRLLIFGTGTQCCR